MFATRGRDPSALSSRQFIETELKENPEFFRAFPHLQRVFEKGGNDAGMDPDDIPNQYVGGGRKYESKKVVNFADLTDKPGYFEGLLHQQNSFRPNETDLEQIYQENERNFIEGATAAVEGPFKYLSAERVAQIHEDVDERLQELEETGLTRNEILFDDANKGIPLRDDPFFQLIKQNHTAREMLIGPNENFTADRIIEKALRQDVGVDNSLSNSQSNF